jgi:hypothetical protein
MINRLKQAFLSSVGTAVHRTYSPLEEIIFVSNISPNNFPPNSSDCPEYNSIVHGVSERL